MSEAKDPRLVEAIANAQEAALNTRTLYPYTKASHVFTEDGSTLEPAEEVTEEKEPEEESSTEPESPEEPTAG